MQPRYLNATDMIYILLFSREAIKGKLYFMFLFIELFLQSSCIKLSRTSLLNSWEKILYAFQSYFNFN